MPLGPANPGQGKKPEATAPDTTGATKAQAVFKKLSVDFGSMPSVTEPVSFRVPKGEKARLRLLFARHGHKLTDGIKKAVYQYARQLERDEADTREEEALRMAEALARAAATLTAAADQVQALDPRKSIEYRTRAADATNAIPAGLRGQVGGLESEG